MTGPAPVDLDKLSRSLLARADAAERRAGWLEMELARLRVRLARAEGRQS